MANVCDYVRWRGDLTFEQDAFNEVDALILSRFSYFPFDPLLQENESAAIAALSQRFAQQEPGSIKVLWPDDRDLFPLMGASARFGSLEATAYVNILSREEDEQFSAITVLLPDDSLFVSFRGTDATIVGWKEDFLMSFDNHISARTSAKAYLQRMAAQYPDRTIRVAGHSKGGNLAIYAAAFANPTIRDKITEIYNHDGPGFLPDITESSAYQAVLGRIHRYLPQSSIIGRLMEHADTPIVLQSDKSNIMQHDLYSWQVLGNRLLRSEALSDESEFFAKTFRSVFENSTAEVRKQVIVAVFDVLQNTHAQTFKELRSDAITNSAAILSSVKNYDKETIKLIFQFLNLLLKGATDSFTEINPLGKKEVKSV